MGTTKLNFVGKQRTVTPKLRPARRIFLEEGEERGVRGNVCMPLAGGSSGRLGQEVQVCVDVAVEMRH